jgi:FecR protein
VNRFGRLESSTQLITLLAAVVLSLTVAFAGAAIPFDRATVTRTQNKVSYGQIAEGKGRTRPANQGDIVGPKNYLLTESESRAELQYDDGSVVRIGQNTVFSFEARRRSRALRGKFRRTRSRCWLVK